MNKKLSLFLLLISAGLLVALAAGPAFAGNHADGQGQGPPEHLKVQARPVFEIEGVVYTDAKENGLVEIGVVREELAVPVKKKLKQLGIPLDSVQIVVTQPIVYFDDGTTLQGHRRPLEGGLQIQFIDGAFAYSCTLGFNAVRDGVNGFVTNSHCTSDQFEVDGTEHFQSSWNGDGHQIGTEIADPPSFKGGDCDVNGKKCRWSDAAFDELASGVSATVGSIAKPDGMDNGSLTIDSNDGSFTITAEAAGNAEVGTTLNKVGRTTGWTQGLVTNDCVDTGVLGGGNILLLCQDFVEAEVGGGDSGSPVFEITSGDNVTLNGILWGGAMDGSYFVYSPISNIQREDTELGALTTFGTVSPGITVSPTTGLVTTEALGTDTFTVVLDTLPTDDVTIDLSSSDESEGTVSPISLTFTSSNGTTAQTVTVTGVNDGDVDGDIAYTIVTAAAGSDDTDYSGTDPADVSVSNTDDDGASVVAHVEFTTPITEAKGNSGKVKLYITIDVDDPDGNPVANATVDLTLNAPDGSTASGSATTGSDGEVTFELTGSDAPRGDYTSQVTYISGTDITFDNCTTKADSSMDESKISFTVNEDGTVTQPIIVVDDCPV